MGLYKSEIVFFFLSGKNNKTKINYNFFSIMVKLHKTLLAALRGLLMFRIYRSFESVDDKFRRNFF